MKSLILLTLLIALAAGTASAGVKKIAVLDFEDTSIASNDLESNPMAALAILSGRQPSQTDKGRIGKGVASILVTELAKDNVFKIIERSQIEQVIAEQNFSKNMSLNATDAAKIGRLLGVSGIVVGSVTEFNTKTATKGVLGIGTKVKTATVALNARLIDTSTAEVVFAAEGKGVEEESNLRVGSLYGSNTTGASDTLLSSATKKAAADVIMALKAHAAKIKDQVIECVVVNIDRSDNSIMVDAGSEAGLMLGQPMYAVRITKEIKNKQGEVLKRLSSVVGEFKVKEVEKKVSTLTCVSGSCSSIKEGDTIVSAK